MSDNLIIIPYGEKGAEEKMKVSIMITCLADAIYPHVGEAMAKILARYGVETHFPHVQTCCGQPAFNSGYWDEARASASTMFDAFYDCDFVITLSGSCAGMIHHYYPKLFEHDGERLRQAEELKAKTYEFSYFLVNVMGITELDAAFPHKVTYHPSCHGSRLLGVKDEPLRLLKQVRGLELVPLPYADDCCGFGGTFAIKMSDISAAMVREKADHVLETEAEVLVGLDLGCLMNISGHLRHRGEPVRVMHMAELLAEAMGVNV